MTTGTAGRRSCAGWSERPAAPEPDAYNTSKTENTMALNELMHNLPDVVPLIPGSGVQFLDLGFSIDKQTDVPKEWGFFDPRTTSVTSSVGT